MPIWQHPLLHSARQDQVATMANLNAVIAAYKSLQSCRFEPHITVLTTGDGRITIPAIDFLSFGGITDTILLNDFVKFIKRDKLAMVFRLLLNLDWGTSPGGINCKLSFNLLVPMSEVDKLRRQEHVPVITPAPASMVDVVHNADDLNGRLPSETNLNLMIENDFAAMKVKIPPSLKRRLSKKALYSAKTLAKYASELERSISLLIESTVLSKNVNLQNQVLQDVLRRLGNKVGNNETVDVTRTMITNIKRLVDDMREFGTNDIEQIKYLEGLALALSGGVSVARMMRTTGLSKRTLEYGKELRKKFDEETAKARIESETISANSAVNNVQNANQTNSEDNEVMANQNNIDSDNETVYSEESVSVDDNSGKRKRAKRGEGAKKLSINRYRPYISRKFRKTRSDLITGVEVQRFCHESRWGGRLDTLKLSKQQVLIEQPLGGFQYESIRSYQYTVVEMYSHFKSSEYGARQRMENSNRDLSIRRFRELICPCMTLAKQRDTADEIIAEFKHCLLTWDVNMRKKDRNVRSSIERCQLTECKQHQNGSSSAELYAMASKSPQHFLKYLLCPQIQRDELAIKISDSNSSFKEKLALSQAANIEAATASKLKDEKNYWASGAKKGE